MSRHAQILMTPMNTERLWALPWYRKPTITHLRYHDTSMFIWEKGYFTLALIMKHFVGFWIHRFLLTDIVSFWHSCWTLFAFDPKDSVRLVRKTRRRVDNIWLHQREGRFKGKEVSMALQIVWVKVMRWPVFFEPWNRTKFITKWSNNCPHFVMYIWGTQNCSSITA